MEISVKYVTDMDVIDKNNHRTLRKDYGLVLDFSLFVIRSLLFFYKLNKRYL